MPHDSAIAETPARIAVVAKSRRILLVIARHPLSRQEEAGQRVEVRQ